jgi:hypothetical protein
MPCLSILRVKCIFVLKIRSCHAISIDRGIWTRDIKIATSIPQHTLTKTLKVLENRNLVKSVRSVLSKSKKLYMITEMEPAKEITGGPWYSDQEFDHDFVHELSRFIVQLVSTRGMIGVKEISDVVKEYNIAKVYWHRFRFIIPFLGLSTYHIISFCCYNVLYAGSIVPRRNGTYD